MQDKKINIITSTVKQAIGQAIWSFSRNTKLSPLSNEELGRQFLKLFNGDESEPSFSPSLILDILNQTAILSESQKTQVNAIAYQGLNQAILNSKGTYTLHRNYHIFLKQNLASLGLTPKSYPTKDIKKAKEFVSEVFKELYSSDSEVLSPSIIFSRILVFAKTVNILKLSQVPLEGCNTTMQDIEGRVISSSENFTMGFKLMDQLAYCLNV